MFGYVIPLKPEMKVKEFEIFRAYYCGLCNHIKKDFGNIPRVILNYDMTFLGMLLDSIDDKNPKAIKSRCFVHLNKKNNVIIDNEALSYAAAMNVSLIYYKLLDDINDENNIKSKFNNFMLSPYRKKFNDNIKEINFIIEENLSKLAKLEKDKNFSSLDEICEPFSIIVGKILELYPQNLKENKNLKENLYKLGYSLGKWIYLIDALDDLEEDILKNKFNPINILFNLENETYDKVILKIKDRIEFTILNCGASCIEALNDISIKRNKEILENIINLGMMDKYTKVINNCNCKNKRRDKDGSI